jgi:hypothetical protein
MSQAQLKRDIHEGCNYTHNKKIPQPGGMRPLPESDLSLLDYLFVPAARFAVFDCLLSSAVRK